MGAVNHVLLSKRRSHPRKGQYGSAVHRYGTLVGMNDVPGLRYDESDAVTVHAHYAAQECPVSTDIADTAHRTAVHRPIPIGCVDVVRVGTPMPAVVDGSRAMVVCLPAMVICSPVMTSGATPFMVVAGMLVGGVALAAAMVATPVGVAVLLVILFIMPRATIVPGLFGQYFSRAEGAYDRDRGAHQDDLDYPFHQLFLQIEIGCAVRRGHICKAKLYGA